MWMKIHVRMDCEILWLLESKECFGKVCVLCHELYYWQICYKYIYLFACWMATSVSEYMHRWMVGWLMSLRECGKKLSCSDLRYYPAFTCCSVSCRYRKIHLFYQQYNRYYPAIERYYTLFLCSVFEYTGRFIMFSVITNIMKLPV
jgi:hypothetical protein